MGLSSKVCIFIPTFNVEETIISTLERLLTLDSTQFESILVVDNGSSDSTTTKIFEYVDQKSIPNLFLLRNKKNIFLGGSTVVALDWAIKRNCDYLLCVHSDGQADASEVKKFFPYLDGKHDFVFGSRLLPESKVQGYSLLRLMGNKFFVYFQQRISGSDINDIGSMTAFKLKTIQQLPYSKIPQDMAYQPLLVLSAFQRLKSLQYVTLPISWGEVRNSNVNPITYGLKHFYRLMLLGINPHLLLSSESPNLVSDELVSNGRPSRENEIGL